MGDGPEKRSAPRPVPLFGAPAGDSALERELQSVFQSRELTLRQNVELQARVDEIAVECERLWLQESALRGVVARLVVKYGGPEETLSILLEDACVDERVELVADHDPDRGVTFTVKRGLEAVEGGGEDEVA